MASVYCFWLRSWSPWLSSVASAIPTLHRLGYAIGAAAIGIVANAAGFGEGISAESARNVGFWIVAASIPFAGLGLLAALNFVRDKAATT